MRVGIKEERQSPAALSLSVLSLCAISLGVCGIGDANAEEVLAGHLKSNTHLTVLG